MGLGWPSLLLWGLVGIWDSTERMTTGVLEDACPNDEISAFIFTFLDLSTLKEFMAKPSFPGV